MTFDVLIFCAKLLQRYRLCKQNIELIMCRYFFMLIISGLNVVIDNAEPKEYFTDSTMQHYNKVHWQMPLLEVHEVYSTLNSPTITVPDSV